jgi:hypothetical protein
MDNKTLQLNGRTRAPRSALVNNDEEKSFGMENAIEQYRNFFSAPGKITPRGVRE